MKKVLSLLLALCMALSVCAFAASSFSDMSEESHPWAVKEIEEMTVLGIIKGYTDGTFRPDQPIRKIEALILAARAAGYTNEDYASFAAFAKELYSGALERYETDYKGEVAFLLYKGILGVDELNSYLANGNANTEFKRDAAAILFTRIMGGDDVASADSGLLLPFADAAAIAINAKGYVQYVYDNGIMNGMDDNKFEPDISLTRAQVAVMLYRVLGKMDMSFKTGIVTNVDSVLSVLRYRDSDGLTASVAVNDEIKVVVDGQKANLADVKRGAEVAVVYNGAKIVAVEALSPETPVDDPTEPDINVPTVTKPSGKLVSANVSNSPQITIADLSTGDNKSYPLADSYTVIRDGEASSIAKLSKGDYIVLTLSGGSVVVVEAEAKNKTVEGTVTAIELGDVATALTIADDKGVESTYLAEDTVKVTRNGTKDLALGDVLIGDKVAVTLEYDLISSIVASSTKSTVTGTISKIIIASQPGISLKVDGVETDYALSPSASYTVSGVVDANIYSLELGWTVNARVEGGTVTAIETKTVSSVGSYTGTITSINSSYYSFTLAVTDTTGALTSQQIFASRSGSSVNANIYDADGKEIAFKKLKEGDSVIVSGAYSNGIFEAKTILVLE